MNDNLKKDLGDVEAKVADLAEKAKEKRAEEQKNSEENSEDEEKLPDASKKVELQANSVEEMLEKIFGIKWDEVSEQVLA